jgi:tRNA(fMet)-specific endonuclease VapC
MSEPILLIDTSTLSEVIKGRDAEVRAKAQLYLNRHGRFTFSSLTRFEILRGLRAKRAERQLVNFELFSSQSDVLPLDDAAIVEAARIYGLLYQRGQLIDDVDILIAATAKIRGMGVITENVEHFNRIDDLAVQSWRSQGVGG